MIILGFDSASHVTGWAVISDGPSGPSLGAYGRIRIIGKKPIGERLAAFRDSLSDLIDNHHPDVICYEDTHVRFFTAAKPLFKFNGIIDLMSFERLGKEAVPIKVPVIRGFVGSSSKAGVRDKIAQIFKVKISKEKFDESDAIAVAWTGLHVLVPTKEAT